MSVRIFAKVVISEEQNAMSAMMVTLKILQVSNACLASCRDAQSAHSKMPANVPDVTKTTCLHLQIMDRSYSALCVMKAANTVPFHLMNV